MLPLAAELPAARGVSLEAQSRSDAERIDAATKKAEDEAKTKFWAGLLMVVGGLLVVGAAILAVYSSTVDVKTTVSGKDDPGTTEVEPSTTIVENARIPDSLVTTTLGAGAALLLGHPAELEPHEWHDVLNRISAGIRSAVQRLNDPNLDKCSTQAVDANTV